MKLLAVTLTSGLLVALAFTQVDCKHKSTSTYDAGFKASLAFPCVQGFNYVDSGKVFLDATPDGHSAKLDAGNGIRDSGIPVANDPNNCGQCGTLCGTYVNQGAGFSEQQGICIGVNCNTPVPTNNPPVVIATSTTDCLDNYGAGWVVNTQDGAPRWNSKNGNYPEAGQGQCINICTDPANCGALGHKCAPGLFCQFCGCH
jgi:hypothetical protein